SQQAGSPETLSHNRSLRPLAGMGLALIAGLVVWGLISLVDPVFHVPKEFEVPNIGASPEAYLANRQAQERVEREHARLYVGCLGLLVAVVLRLREGVTRRSWLLPLMAAPVGMGGGILGGWLGSAVHDHFYEAVGMQDLIHTLLAQLALLVPLGVGVGLGASEVRVKPRSSFPVRNSRGALWSALAGAAAGVVAAVGYPIIVALVMPKVSTELLLPVDAASRLLWIGLV